MKALHKFAISILIVSGGVLPFAVENCPAVPGIGSASGFLTGMALMLLFLL